MRRAGQGLVPCSSHIFRALYASLRTFRQTSRQADIANVRSSSVTEEIKDHLA